MRSPRSSITLLAAAAALAVCASPAAGETLPSSPSHGTALAQRSLPTPAKSTEPSSAVSDARPAPGEVTPLGECWVGGRICGNVYNRDNRYNLLITNQWGKHYDRSTWRILRPGQNGHHVGVRDVDGYWVGPGCKVKRSLGLRTVGPGWHKVRNGQKLQIVDIRC
ncbi:hypothetical protein [Streptomyces sp. NPDC057302]|uniref:hypothetical protein n=1 Tax=Streptomyces sp. NPDC057302 TaxID=3346094 RepID=UPI00362B035C